MSKIGKINISIPEKVKVILSGNNINIEGPLGKKTLNIDLDMFELTINNENKEVKIKPKKITDTTKRLWGMNRSLINNAIIGSSAGYEKILELVGVGYRAALKDKKLNLQLGFSHDINFDIPDGITITVEKQTIVKVSGADKQQVGMIVAQIKSFRPPEPYKGKGIREQGQYILRKEGKKK
jgi:large subunit ribosomal protein L6